LIINFSDAFAREASGFLKNLVLIREHDKIEGVHRSYNEQIAILRGPFREMIRNLKSEFTEARFSVHPALHPVQWLTDNGSRYIAAETIEHVILSANH
jgi:transposase InsO family protein